MKLTKKQECEVKKLNYEDQKIFWETLNDLVYYEGIFPEDVPFQDVAETVSRGKEFRRRK